MRNAGRWVLLVAVIAVCLVAAVAARMTADRAWNAVVDYTSPYAKEPLDPVAGGSEVASRTVLVIVDGLRLDTSRTMPALNALRAYGADVTLTAPQPSLSYPNWTTLLAGTPPYLSGVVTNWHDGEAGVETLFDTARTAWVSTVFVGPEDFETLYGVRDRTEAAFMRKWQKRYLSGTYVDQAIALGTSINPRLMIVHLPDVDEAGHAYGGASPEYAAMAARVDGDIGRLVAGLQDERTVFVVVADHGHVDAGGHGGWEPEVVQVPGVIAGVRVPLTSGEANSEDVAATVAQLAGIGTPRLSQGAPIASVLGTRLAQAAVEKQQAAFWRMHGLVVGSDVASQPPAAATTSRALKTWDAQAQEQRLARERQQRLTLVAIGAFVCLLILVLVFVGSRQAFIAVLAGAAAYYVVYNGLFFVVHGYDWSLSGFNSEDLVTQWLMMRMAEAAIAALVGAFVAGIVYPFTRKAPMGPTGTYLPGWLTLGPTVSLVVLATLGLQIAWFVWAWGLVYTWRLPDLMWGMKFDLDLVQATAVGAVAVIAPLVTYLVGRYHPRMARKVSRPPKAEAATPTGS